MSTKVIKYISVCLLVLAFGAFGTGVAKAALTANATALTSDGVLTITGLAASVWSLTTDAAAEDLTVGITGAFDASLILSSTGTGADAMQITTSAGGLDISVTGNLAGEDLDITTVGATTEMRLTSASTTADSIAIQAITTTAGIDIDSGTGGIAINTATTGAINIDTGTTGAINLGVGAAAKTITIGNAASTLLDLDAISIDIDGAATGVTIDALDAGSVNLGTSTVAASDGAAVNVGTGGARTVTVGNATGATAVNVDTGTAGMAHTSTATTAGAFRFSSTTLTTGNALSITSTNTAVADTAAGISSVLLAATNAQATVAQAAGGGVNALRVNFTNNPSIAANTENVVMIQNQVTSNATDNAVASLLLLDNADTTPTGSTVVTDALRITNSGAIAAGITNAINIASTTVVTDLSLQNGETLDNDTDAQFMFGRNTAGIVVITAKDDNANADLTVSSGGTGTLTLDAGAIGAIVIGSADVTSITITADGTADGTDLVLPPQGVNGSEMLNDTVTATQLNAALTFAALDFVDLALVVHNTTATQGLRLPQAASATPSSPISGEGYIAWNAADNQVIAYSGTAWVTAIGNTTAANTWTDNQIFTFVADEDIAISHDAGALTGSGGVLKINVTPNAVDTANVSGIYIDNLDSVNASGLDSGLTIDNSDITGADMADGILFSSAGAVITDAIDASAAAIVNAISIGANNILSTGTVTFSRASAGVVTLAPADDTGAADITLDALLAGAIIIGSADVTSVTITTDNGAATDVSITGGVTVARADTIDALTIGGTATTGDAIDITPGTARTSGAALLVTDASIAATVSGDLIQIDVTGTPDTNTIDIDVTGIATAASNALDITYASVAALGNAIDLNMGTNVAGDALNIASTSATGQAVQIDAVTSLNTAGILDINIDAGNAAVDGINISLTQNDLAAAAVDATALEILLTANDADGDMFGLTITGAATVNAAAGSYEAGILIENLEDIAATMTSAILVRATTDTAITTALDVSDGEIVNALSIGANAILGTNFSVTAAGIVTGVNLLVTASATTGVDTAAAGALSLGNVTATSVSLCNSAACDTITIGTNADADTITIGNTTAGTTVNINAGGAAAGDGVRNAAARQVNANKSAAVVIGDAVATPTVTQILDASIFTVAASVNRTFTPPTAQTATGLVQELPGAPTVGDIFTFVISNSGASTVTLTNGTGSTFAGNTVIGAGATKVVTCRVDGITANTETITCY